MTEPAADGGAQVDAAVPDGVRPDGALPGHPVDEATPDTDDAGAESVDDTAAAQAAGAARARKRGRETARDMVWSLAVVGIFVVFLVAVTYRPKPEAVQVVDPTLSVQTAQAMAPFAVVVPTGLPASWRPTSARFEPAATSTVPNAALWHIGYVTPSGAYASLDQVAGDPKLAVTTLVDGAHEVGPGAGDFAGWTRWETGSGERQAYVLAGSASTVVVYGSAGDSELATLERSLVPDPAHAVDVAKTPLTS